MSNSNVKTKRHLWKIHPNLLTLGLFGLSMGALEAIVVVYLRQIYYPGGFDFPLVLLSQQMMAVEWLREIATIGMLVTVGIIAGQNFLQRTAYFLYSFAIWDIFYYIWLKLLIQWPESFLTWDLLFLIPVPWIGPVLAPVICSLTMIFFAGIILYLQEREYAVKIRLSEWSMIFFGAFILLGTFMVDYIKIVMQDGFNLRYWTVATNGQFPEAISHYYPTRFNWIPFILGEILIVSALVVVYRRTKSVG